MRRLLCIALIMVFALLSASCAGAKKPEAPEQQPRTVVVPEVTKISFDSVDLDKAPDLVRDVADQMSKRDGATWVQENNTIYLLVSQGERSKGLKADVDQVLQRVPRDNLTWLDVKVIYEKVSEEKEDKDTSNKPSVFKVNRTDRDINGVGFDFVNAEDVKEEDKANKEDKEPKAANPAPGNAAPSSPAPSAQVTPREEQEAQITAPKPNETVTSPLTVKGTTGKMDGQLRARLRTEGGRVLAEVPMSAPAAGTFEVTLNYSAPETSQRGVVELIKVDNKDGSEDVESQVRVIIK